MAKISVHAVTVHDHTHRHTPTQRRTNSSHAVAPRVSVYSVQVSWAQRLPPGPSVSPRCAVHIIRLDLTCCLPIRLCRSG